MEAAVLSWPWNLSSTSSRIAERKRAQCLAQSGEALSAFESGGWLVGTRRERLLRVATRCGTPGRGARASRKRDSNP